MSAVHFVAEGRPISTNATYRRGKGRRLYKTPEATAWWARVQLAAKIAMRRRKSLEGSLAVTLRFYFPNGRSDVDGGIKPVLDAMQGLVYGNDRAVRRLAVDAYVDPERPRVEVEAVEIAPDTYGLAIARKAPDRLQDGRSGCRQGSGGGSTGGGPWSAMEDSEAVEAERTRRALACARGP